MTGRKMIRGSDVTIRLADILNDLREDHRNIAIMLDLLERETGRIRDGEKPDYELIHDIMRYLTVYADAVHHPKEDILYSAIKTERPDLADGLEQVEPEHQELARLGEALRNDIEAVASGAAVKRDRIVADTSNYVALLRHHMDWEEGDLFKRAASLVDAEAAMFVDISRLNALDPVFGPEREHTFTNLLENIKALAKER
jgi:hemerythrin-like domain-containing protein